MRIVSANGTDGATRSRGLPGFVMLDAWAIPRSAAPPEPDLEALPESVIGELIGGVLYTMTRPRPRQARAASVLGGDLNGAYDRGRGGPGGWWILVEPGFTLPDLDVEEIAPDVAGWKRDRLPELPKDCSDRDRTGLGVRGALADDSIARPQTQAPTLRSGGRPLDVDRRRGGTPVDREPSA